MAKKTPILHRWIQNIRATFPHAQAEWSSRRGDEFVRPVGHLMVKEMEAIFEGLLRGGRPADFSGSLDRIMRVRAVQDFSPAQAVSVLFQLKEAIRTELRDELRESQTCLELFAFETEIDALALLSFDLYMKCREDIHELKLKEAKAAGSRMSGSARGAADEGRS